MIKYKTLQKCGNIEITALDKCKKAAEALKKSWKGNANCHQNWPKGCFVQNDGVYYNSGCYDSNPVVASQMVCKSQNEVQHS